MKLKFNRLNIKENDQNSSLKLPIMVNILTNCIVF